MGACSRSSRRGMALAWSAGLAVLLLLFGWVLSSMGLSATRSVAQASSAQAYRDLCASALAEAVLVVRAAAGPGGSLAGLPLHEALGAQYPFDRDAAGNATPPKPIPVPLTQALARTLHGDRVVIESVRLASGERMSPGEADPLVGAIELVATVRGTLGGRSGGRELRHRYPFLVPCAVRTRAAPTAEYSSVAFGEPRLYTQRIAALERSL